MYEPEKLFAGIPLVNPDTGRDPGHDQVTKYLLTARDHDPDARVPRHGGGQTVNHMQGYDVTAMARWRLGFERDEGRLAEIVNMLEREREWGLNLGEVNSATYCERSAGYRAILWAETRTAREQGDLPALRSIEALCLDWFRGHRALRRLFRAANGLVYGPGIRVKWERDAMELQHFTSHFFLGGVHDTKIRRLIESDAKVDPERMTFRRDEAVFARFYASAAGQELKRLTGDEHQPRLSTKIFVRRSPAGGYEAWMPEIRVIPESHGWPPHVLWYVRVDDRGRIVETLYESERRVRPGEMMYAPESRFLGSVTHMLGPGTRLADLQPAPPVDQAQRREPIPELRPQDVTRAMLRSHPNEAQAIILAAEDLEQPDLEPQAWDNLQRALGRGDYRGVVRAMALVDQGLTTDPDLIAAVEAFRRAVAG